MRWVVRIDVFRLQVVLALVLQIRLKLSSQHFREELKVLARALALPVGFFAPAHAGLLWEE